MARPGQPGTRTGGRPTHPGVVFASFGCCQPREKMDEKVRTKQIGPLRKPATLYCEQSDAEQGSLAYVSLIPNNAHRWRRQCMAIWRMRQHHERKKKHFARGASSTLSITSSKKQRLGFVTHVKAGMYFKLVTPCRVINILIKVLLVDPCIVVILITRPKALHSCSHGEDFMK
jgi:hypothetical protein